MSNSAFGLSEEVINKGEKDLVGAEENGCSGAVLAGVELDDPVVVLTLKLAAW